MNICGCVVCKYVYISLIFYHSNHVESIGENATNDFDSCSMQQLLNYFLKLSQIGTTNSHNKFEQQMTRLPRKHHHRSSVSVEGSPLQSDVTIDREQFRALSIATNINRLKLNACLVSVVQKLCITFNLFSMLLSVCPNRES